MTTAFIISMFTLGLGTSLHCVSMCGPLVLTYAVKGTEDGPWYRKLTPNLAYQGAKVVSYMLVGLLLGTIGSALNLDAARPYVYYVAGVFMIILGLGMTGKVPWAARLTPRPPQWLMNTLLKMRRKSAADAAAGEHHLATPITFGLMTGLLPCGPLMAAQVAAAASGSPISGAAGMAAFALGTAPLMVAFGTAGSLIPRVWKQRMMSVLAIGVILFGLVFINRGLTATGAPINFNTLRLAVIGGPVTSNADYKTGADGVVEIPLVIENTRFVPETVQIPADTPVRLVVDRREASSCSAEIFLPQLGIRQTLADNAVTTVDIPATKAGNYTLTCGMSMMSGQLVVGAGASPLGKPLPWLLLALVGAGGALWVARRRDARVAEQAKPAGKQGGSKGGSKGGAKAAAAEAADAEAAGPKKILGFSPAEFVLILAAIAAAVVAGLTVGGLFAG